MSITYQFIDSIITISIDAERHTETGNYILYFCKSGKVISRVCVGRAKVLELVSVVPVARRREDAYSGAETDDPACGLAGHPYIKLKVSNFIASYLCCIVERVRLRRKDLSQKVAWTRRCQIS